MRQVVAIAKLGSFVRAAEELGIAQSTLSKGVARLEDELAVKLFDRSGTGALPTPVGQYVAARAGHIIAEASRLQREIELVNGGEIGQVRIGLGTGLAPVFLPRFALALNKRYPQLRLYMIIKQRHELIEEVKGGRLDMLILAAEEDLATHELQCVEVMRQTIIAVAASHHPLAGRKGLTAEVFASFPGATNSLAAQFTTRELLGLTGDQEDNSSHFQINEFAAIRALVISGAATSIAYRHLFAEDLEARRVVRLDIHVREPLSVVAATTRPSAHSSLIKSITGVAEVLGRSLEGDPT